jgi:hypothetical protein
MPRIVIIIELKAETMDTEANNHYAGFGPETANIFRKMIGLPLLNWQDAKQEYDKLIQTNNNPAIPAEQKLQTPKF